MILVFFRKGVYMNPLENIDKILSKGGSFIDRFLVRKGEVLYEDLSEELKEKLLIKGEITENDIEYYFRKRLKLSGEISYLDFEKYTKELLARNGLIDYEDLSEKLQQRLIYKEIDERALTAELAFKINNKYHTDYLIIDCGGFETTNVPPEDVIDGGEW